MVTRIDNIRPEMLRWAVCRAGHDADRYIADNEILQAWIAGEKKPTVRQLEDFASKMHVPYGYLFLDTPPTENMPIPMFRGSANAHQMNLNVYDTVLAMQMRQSWLEEYMESLGIEEHDFVASMKMEDGVDAVSERMFQLLGFAKDWAFEKRDEADSVNALIERLEEIGVVTALNGIVGNNTHRPLSVEECRGFSLVSKVAPYLFINNSDAKSAQMFTIVHEFAHILLGESAGFGGMEACDDNATERFCDKVAACFLVSAELLPEVWKRFKGDIDKCARRFKVSRLMLARRAFELGLMSKDEFWSFYNDYKIQWSSRPEKKVSGGGDFYHSAAKRVGKLFGAYVSSAVSSGYLLHRDAYRLTGVYGNTFSKLMSNNMY